MASEPSALVAALTEIVEQGGDSKRVAEAIGLLGRVRDERVEAAVRRALRNGQEEVRIAAAEWLAAHDDSRLAGALELAVEDPSARVRGIAVRALRRLRDAVSIPVFKSVLDVESDEEILDEAARALAELGDLSGVDRLLGHLRSADTIGYLEPAEESVPVLCRLRDPALLPPLLEMLGERNPLARGYAAEVLGHVAGAEVIDQIGSLTRDGEYFPRFMAIQALGRIGGAASRPYLAEALRDEHVNCVKAALRGYFRNGFNDRQDAEAIRGAIESTHDDQVSFYGHLLLARQGLPAGLLGIAALVREKSYVLIRSWEDDTYLDDRELLEYLAPLTGSGVSDFSGAREWATWVLEEASSWAWDDGSESFRSRS